MNLVEVKRNLIEMKRRISSDSVSTDASVSADANLGGTKSTGNLFKRNRLSQHALSSFWKYPLIIGTFILFAIVMPNNTTEFKIANDEQIHVRSAKSTASKYTGNLTEQSLKSSLEQFQGSVRDVLAEIVAAKKEIASLKQDKVEHIKADRGMGWDTKRAIKRAAQPYSPRDFAVTTQVKDQAVQGDPARSVAVFLQLGNTAIWDDLLRCTANVASAANVKNYLVDVYIAFHEEEKDSFENSHKEKQELLQSFNNINNIYFDYTENKGADIFMFMKQLEHMIDIDASYDMILKQHSKSDPLWRLRHIESLCGTPEQVMSIWNQIETHPELGIVAPQGTTLQKDTKVDSIFPVIARKYYNGESTVKAAFDKFSLSKIHDVHEQIRDLNENDNEWNVTSASMAAGSVFWCKSKAIRPTNLIKTLKLNFDGVEWTKGYTLNLGLEHVLERLIVSYAVNNGWQVAEAMPAPRIFPLFFPQYHQFEENDRFWGEGFTEWTLLKPLELDQLKKPLGVEDGGLGFYDLLDKETRQRQGDLARRAGISGFVFYHYWFSGPKSPAHHKVMYKAVEQMLIDGEPDMPFMLSWANEPWTKRWSGLDDQGGEDTLLSQEYGDEEDWTDHFNYLHETFFTHPNYVWIDNMPVFIIYRIGHMEKVLDKILKLLNKLAKENGMDGINIIHTLGNFYNEDKNTKDLEKNPLIDAAFHFWPQCMPIGCNRSKEPKDMVASTFDMPLNVKKQYWGAHAGFDKRPRTPDFPLDYIVKEENFDTGLKTSFEKMSDYSNREVDYNFFFLTAWNEWNEQAVLEPDTEHKFNYLEILRSNLEQSPLRHDVFQKNSMIE
mmetsp:Transcript_10512/g.13327  ORF Transcript_10512/g.13327 Transcript_10512/m.13327 type:complete len:835 (+) Transcript_10512:116-2620(+)